MSELAALALQNALSAPVLFFLLGLGAALARSDLIVPVEVAKAIAIYLMMSIGFKGGAAIGTAGLDGRMLATIGAGVGLSFALPLLGFAILRKLTGLSRVDAAAVAAHYGSISIVTFVAGAQAASSAGLAPEGWLVAVAAAMEAPAVISALWLAGRSSRSERKEPTTHIGREVLLNGSIVVLVGSFLIGWIAGPAGAAAVRPFLFDPFYGVLCLFLLDMGIVAGRGLRQAGGAIDARLAAFALYMPLVSAACAALAALPLGLSAGGAALFITLAASASYIAVPAAMRMALPEARPSIYLTLSLAVTFPFNLTVGVPLYLALGQWIGR